MKRIFVVVAVLLLLIPGVVQAQVLQPLPPMQAPVLRPLPTLRIIVDLPSFETWIVKDHLRAFGELPGFSEAVIVASQPIFSWDGRTVAYYEVKLQTAAGSDVGYVMVSATEEDFPVVEFSHTGVTHFEEFRKTVQEPFRMIRYGAGYLVAEDDRGGLLAEIGFRPQILPEEVRKELLAIEEEEAIMSVGMPIKELPKEPETRPTEFSRVLQAEVSYAVWKTRVDPSMFVRGEPEEIKSEWEDLRARYRQETSLWQWNTAYASSNQCRYLVQRLPTRDSMPRYLQIPANTSPNTTSCASGCGPTAWMNIYGWHHLNGWSSRIELYGARYNTLQIDYLTMGIRSRIKTSRLACNGFTWHYNMKYGLHYARDTWNVQPYYWWRWSLRPSKRNWIYSVARDMMRSERPFIVGYFSDWHYAIGFGTAECTRCGWDRHAWLRIYPAWRTDNRDDKWIRKSDIFGIWGVYSFAPR